MISLANSICYFNDYLVIFPTGKIQIKAEPG